MNADKVRSLALALPEVTEAPHFHSASFRIRGKIFATLPPDGGAAHVFLPEEVRESALAREPAFLEKLFWGGRAWGLRVSLANAKPKVVALLLEKAWVSKAPQSLADQFLVRRK